MFRTLKYNPTRWLLGLLVLLGVQSREICAPTDAQAVDVSTVRCSMRVAKGIKNFTTAVAGAAAACTVDDLKDEDESFVCLEHEDFLKESADAASSLYREVVKCGDEPFYAVCPMDARTPAALQTVVSTGEGSIGGAVGLLVRDLLETPSDASCPRPLGEVSSEAVDCADSAAELLEDALDEFQKCLYKCELSSLRSTTRTPCIEEATGLPALDQPKLEECRLETFEALVEGLSRRCLLEEESVLDDAVLLRELGCPLGQSSILGVGASIWERVYALVVGMDLAIFRSECKSGSTGTPTLAPPARVRLLPSLTEKEIRCGDRLGGTFFGADSTLEFLTDLDCSALTAVPGGEPVDGFQLARSGITISGRTTQSLTGPSRSSLRTGAAIRLIAGVTGTTIKNFKAIQNFGYGIKDAGDNTRLEIDQVTLRRNTVAGVHLRSPGVQLEGVKADRNGSGFVLSGDGTVLKEARALRSADPTGGGVVLSGLDLDGDGRVVRVSGSEIANNATGILIVEGPHFLEANQIANNLGRGVDADGDGGKMESNNVRGNGSDGFRLSGDRIHATANRAEENVGSGFVVTGSGVALDNNVSGVLSDKGNGGHGFRIAGPMAIVESNSAEANGGDGFVFEAVAELIGGNSAKVSTGVGFRVTATGNALATNLAEANGGAEFDLVAGTIDLAGNRKNGTTFSFGAAGGSFE